jgi:hypothetical protein
MAVTRSYQLLSTLPSAKIATCSQMLPNRMQCWKPGYYLVTESTPAPTEANPDALMISSTYQLCKNHALIQNRADQAAIAAVTEAAMPRSADLPDLTNTGDAQQDALNKEMIEQQTSSPQGENSPNNQ